MKQFDLKTLNLLTFKILCNLHKKKSQPTILPFLIAPFNWILYQNEWYSFVHYDMSYILIHFLSFNSFVLVQNFSLELSHSVFCQLFETQNKINERSINQTVFNVVWKLICNSFTWELVYGRTQEFLKSFIPLKSKLQKFMLNYFPPIFFPSKHNLGTPLLN